MEATPQEGLPDVLQFMRVLWGTVHSLDMASKRMAREHGVTGPQRLVLRVVGLRPGISAGALAAILHLHPSTLTGILRRLGSQRLIVRTADAGDRRRAVLRLTARGRAANTLQRGTVEAAVRSALRGVLGRERAAAAAVLAAVTARLDEGTRPERV